MNPDPIQTTPLTPTNTTEAPPTPPVSPIPAPVTPIPASPTISPLNPAKKSPKKLSVIIIAVIVAVFIGSSAGAYYGVIVPSKPENVLKTAIKNTLKQKQVSTKGKFEIESTGSSSLSYTVNFGTQSNVDTKNFAAQLEIASSGFKLPIEARYVDTNIYLKFGDLGTIKSLAQSIYPSMGESVDELSQKLSNKWVEVDHSLLKQAKLDCALESTGLNDEDIDLLIKNYYENPYASIISTSNEKLDGKSSIKYQIEIDDDKSAESIKKLKELSIVKKINECNENTRNLDTKSLADGDRTPITLWVDKNSKRITKIEVVSTEQDAKKSNLKGKLEATISYENVDIQKPADAVPFMQFYGELMRSFQEGLGGGFEEALPSQGPQVGDMLSQTLGAFDIREQ